MFRVPSYRISLGRVVARLGLARLSRDENGNTAVEFAIVAIPFLTFIFGLVGISLYFFSMTSLDRGMDKMGRKIRTGEAQTMTVSTFKQQLCDTAGVWVKCPKVEVFVQNFPSWAAIAPQPCTDASGQVVTNTSNGNDQIAKYSGAAQAIVLVTTCYKWDFAKNIPFVKFGNLSDGSLMMQTATAFRSEPYGNAAPGP